MRSWHFDLCVYDVTDIRAKTPEEAEAELLALASKGDVRFDQYRFAYSFDDDDDDAGLDYSVEGSWQDAPGVEEEPASNAPTEGKRKE